MTSYAVAIVEGGGGYVSTGYVGSGYILAGNIIVETLAGSHGAVRAISQTLTVTGAVKLAISRFFTQALTITELMTRRIVAIRELTQGTGGYTSSGYTITGYEVDNVLDMKDTLARLRDVPRTISEGQVTFTDVTLGAVKGFIRGITEALVVTETLGRLYAAKRTISQTLTNANSVARAFVALRSITETGIITELFTVVKGAIGTGTAKIRSATTRVFKRSTITSIFKRSARTSG